MGLKPFLAAIAIGATVLSIPAVAVADVATQPSGPNPYLSFLPDTSKVDYGAWRTYLTRRAAARATTSAADAAVVHEAEPPGVLGDNDTPASAQRLPGFGSGPNQCPAARILGQLSPSESAVDIDVYQFALRAGDVFAATLQGGAHRLTILDPTGHEVQGSAQDLSALYPESSPLPHGGNAVADHVASVSGTHYLVVSEGSGTYQVDASARRPALERELRPQTVFLDFDGASVDMGIFSVEPSPGVRTLSPLRTFLPGWGLTPDDEPALVAQIVATVRENLAEDLRRSGNPVRLVVRNSLEHPDTFGRDNVSRVVVGGATAEAGFPTVGISQSIDPGNFAQEETALVLQDFLSQPAGPAVSLNTYLTPQSNRIVFIGRAIGNVVSHEIGHFIGSWHTDPTNANVNVMDAGGGNITGFFGVGPDGVGGTPDDTDNDLGSDVFRPSEGFTGTENTLNRTAFGLAEFAFPH